MNATSTHTSSENHVAVVGAGVAGLCSALALARSGHRVTLIERDAAPAPASVEEAFSWARRGAPQFHHSHVFMPRLRLLWRDRFPDVYKALLDAGVPEHEATTLFGADAGDDFLLMPCRRTTYEWVLRRVIDADPGIEMRTGTAVVGLVGSEGADGAAPTITGVRLADGTAVDADLVVVTSGRRGDVPAWLAEFGVEIPEAAEDSGICYLSRFYEALPDHEIDPFGYAVARRAGIAFCGFEADNRTLSITMVVDPSDSEMRRHLREPANFDAACRLMPELAPLVDPEHFRPLTEVHVMGGLVNRLRTFTDGAGAPLAKGLLAVGDAYLVTNPAYGRGCTIAMIQAVLLADALVAHPGDFAAQVSAFEAANASEVVPWYYLSVLLDQVNRNADDGADFTLGATGSSGAFAGNPEVATAIARVFAMIDPPSVLWERPEIMAAMTSGERSQARWVKPTGPKVTREKILRGLASVGSRDEGRHEHGVQELT